MNSQNLSKELKLLANEDAYFTEFLDKVKEDTKVLLMLSGGMDSTTLLYLSKYLWANIYWLEFTYDWRPQVESEIVSNICEDLDINYAQASYPSIYKQNWEKQALSESNAFYYTVASSFAVSHKIDYILSGQIKDDREWSNTAEASPKFYSSFNSMLEMENNWSWPEVLTPLINLYKPDIVRLWNLVDVPFDKTRSCTSDTLEVCWSCEQCMNRADAFNHSSESIENKVWWQLMTIDLFECDYDKLVDKEYFSRFPKMLCEQIDMVPYGDTLVERFWNGPLEWFSMMQFIETSSITVHLDENLHRAYIDIFSCKTFDKIKTKKFCQEFFWSKRVKYRNLYR